MSKPIINTTTSASTLMDKYGLFSILCIIAAAFLLFDFILPLGIAAGVSYVIVILLGLWLPVRRQIITITLIGVLFTIIGYYFTPVQSADTWIILINRGLALFVIICTGLVIYVTKKTSRFEGDDLRNKSVDKTQMHYEHVISNLKQTPYDGINSISYYGILISLPVLILVVGMSFWINTKSEEAGRWVAHTHEVQKSLSQVLSILQDAETGQRGYLLTSEANYLEPYTIAIDRLDSVVAKLNNITSDNPNQQNRLVEIKPLIDKKLKELAETIFLMDSRGQGSALSIVATGEGKKFMDQIRASIKEMEDEESALLKDREQVLYKNKVFALATEIIGIVLLILIGTFINFKARNLLSLQLKTEQKLRYMANHDTLTGLATRRLGLEYIPIAIAHARRNKNKAAVLFIDLDGFKAINDTLGHDAGDYLLQGVAERLSSCVREMDMVVRVGGDEFIIVMSNITSREDTALIAQKLIDALTKSFSLAGKEASIGASIGIALYPDHGQESESLIKLADEAMYQVKGNGKNHFVFAADKSNT